LTVRHKRAVSTLVTVLVNHSSVAVAFLCAQGEVAKPCVRTDGISCL